MEQTQGALELAASSASNRPPLQAILEPVLVGDITGNFYVPAYQRGYRWGETEVHRLLDDIWASRNKPYYLQPVVVKPHGQEWELVDGQQRLTTLHLIFGYMRRAGLQSAGANYSLRYETRQESAKYLESPDAELSDGNIDFFHIYRAHRCIEEWFGRRGDRRQYVANKFYDALFEHVKVIWYQAPDDLDATTLFTRLNVGRIPLTDSELVKALLLSCDPDQAAVIAAQWDAIERDLLEPELWAFIAGSAADHPTRIGLLLDSLAGGPTGRDRPLFHTFETLRHQVSADPQGFWDEVVDRHSLIRGWYDNRDLFHKIGFLIADKVPLPTLIDRSRSKTKSQFEAELEGLIGDRLNLTAAQLSDLGYSRNVAATSRALLLMNVETVRSRRNSSERYSFHEHSRGGWSLEHIHAQNAERLNQAEQWEEWLRMHRGVLAALKPGTPLLDRIDEVLAGTSIKETDFRPLEREIVESLSLDDGGEMDSISNLALLAGGDNSALSNSVFAVKRAEILARDRHGSYIPACTRNVFLKYYSPADEHQMHFWSINDRRHYLKEMTRILGPYLRSEQDAP